MTNIDDFTIYVPSRGRADIVTTVRKLPPEWQERAYIVCPTKEAAEYHRHNKVGKVVSLDADGIGPTRQWMIEYCPTRYLFMIDDDLYFFHRARPGNVPLVPSNIEDMRAMFKRLMRASEEYAHGGVTARPNTSFYLCDYRVCQRVNNFHYFDTRIFHEKKNKDIRFDELRVMEDFHVTLSLLRRGYPNYILMDYCWNQPGTNTRGGCSSYRTAKRQAKAAHRLQRRHPDFVTVVQKDVIGAKSWEGMKSRTDVRINWHEAYEARNGEHPHWKLEYHYNRSNIDKKAP